MIDCETEISPIANVMRTSKDTLSWPPPPKDWATLLGAPAQVRNPPPTIVHIWAAHLEVAPEALTQFEATLAPGERERASRFVFALHRNRFIAGRGMLRRLLAGYGGTQPDSLEFTYGPQGKPALSGSAAGLQFNVAHSGDLVLVAVTRSGVVGVDVEEVRTLADCEELVARFFSADECSKFRGLPAEEKPAAFFNLWTRKEAWLKATGEGITHLLNQVEVSFLPSEPARLIRLPIKHRNTNSWSLYELAPKPGFAAALAIASDAPTIHCWRYPPG